MVHRETEAVADYEDSLPGLRHAIFNSVHSPYSHVIAELFDPDLLEACERLLKYDATCRDDDWQELNDIRARAKDAIAKATRP